MATVQAARTLEELSDEDARRAHPQMQPGLQIVIVAGGPQAAPHEPPVTIVQQDEPPKLFVPGKHPARMCVLCTLRMANSVASGAAKGLRARGHTRTRTRERFALTQKRPLMR
jgi:hypothetical protein